MVGVVVGFFFLGTCGIIAFTIWDAHRYAWQDLSREPVATLTLTNAKVVARELMDGCRFTPTCRQSTTIYFVVDADEQARRVETERKLVALGYAKVAATPFPSEVGVDPRVTQYRRGEFTVRFLVDATPMRVTKQRTIEPSEGARILRFEVDNSTTPRDQGRL